MTRSRTRRPRGGAWRTTGRSVTAFASIAPAADRVKVVVRPSGNSRAFPLSEVADDADRDDAGHTAWVRGQIEWEAPDVLKA